MFISQLVNTHLERLDISMKIIKKAGAAIVAAALTLSLCSCNDLSWVAKFDDETTVPSGFYIYSMAEDYRSAVSNYQLSSSESLEDQTIEVSDSDQKATDYLDDQAIKNVKSYVGVYQKFKDMELELTEDEISSATSSASTTYEEDAEVFEQNGIAQSSVEEYYMDIARKSKVFQAIYGKDGTNAISDKELKTYFNENYASINFIQQYFYNDDGTAMTDDEKEALIKEYKSIKSKAEKGKIKFTDVCEKYSDEATSYKGGYTDSISRFDKDDEDGAKILSLKTGKFTLLITDSAIALIQKATLDKDGSLFSENRDSLLIEYKYQDFINEMIAYGESLENVEFNEAAFKKFSSSTRDFSELSIDSSYSY